MTSLCSPSIGARSNVRGSRCANSQGAPSTPDAESRRRRLFDALVVVAEVFVNIHHVTQILDSIGGDPCCLQPFRRLPL